MYKDSVRLFLRFMRRHGRGTRWGHIITPETLNHMITQNAVRCVKVALEGQAPELGRCRAGPNCMTQYGYFPLHRAAEMFSVDMIELLVRHGASANLRTSGAEVMEGLLPLHVAVDNTSMHKYLEDSLFPNLEGHDYIEHRDYSEADVSYIFRLIHLLCLPEMVCLTFPPVNRLLILLSCSRAKIYHASQTSDIEILDESKSGYLGCYMSRIIFSFAKRTTSRFC